MLVHKVYVYNLRPLTVHHKLYINLQLYKPPIQIDTRLPPCPIEPTFPYGTCTKRICIQTIMPMEMLTRASAILFLLTVLRAVKPIYVPCVWAHSSRLDIFRPKRTSNFWLRSLTPGLTPLGAIMFHLIVSFFPQLLSKTTFIQIPVKLFTKFASFTHRTLFYITLWKVNEEERDTTVS